MLPEFSILLKQARIIAVEELPQFLGELEQIRVTALARLTGPRIEARPDELLDVKQAAKRLHVSENYVYRHHKRLPFTRRQGTRLLFSSNGLDAYLRKRS